MRIICIVQARMGSERLKGKVMKKVSEIPLIGYTLKRLKKSKYIDEIILATSIKEDENTLVDYVTSLEIPVFRGDEDNVLSRYKKASDKYRGDIILRVTGDCPFIDSVIVDNIITKFLSYNYDYLRLDVPDSFIRGFDVEIFTKEALDKVNNIVNVENRDNNSDKFRMYKEHVTYYIYSNPQKFNIGSLKGEDFYNKDYRLCVDTPEDFNLIVKIMENFDDIYVSSKEIVEYLDNNITIANINREIKQRL